jgi:hypothetical protein
MRISFRGLFAYFFIVMTFPLAAQESTSLDVNAMRGETIASYDFSDPKQLSDWVLEGPAKVEVKDGRLEWDASPGHSVLWLKPHDIQDFVLEWEMIPYSEKGLAIVFFRGRGGNGEDLFSPSLKPRDGVFDGYIRGDINSYHFSYWATHRPENKNNEPPTVHMRKNAGFHLVTEGPHPGPAPHATWAGQVHRYAVVAKGPVLTLLQNDKVLLQYDDQGKFGPPHLFAGKVALRVMKHTGKIAYDNVRLSKLK